MEILLEFQNVLKLSLVDIQIIGGLHWFTFLNSDVNLLVFLIIITYLFYI